MLKNANQFFTVLLLICCVLCTPVASANQTNDSDKYTFDNYGGEKFTPQPMEFGENLKDHGKNVVEISSTTKVNDSERKYVLLQFYSIPTEGQLELLEEHGVQRVGVAAKYTLIVSMPASLTPADLPAEAGLRWMGEIPVENKYDKYRGLNVPEWARAEDGQVEIWIGFYEDVTYEEAQAIANKYSISTPNFEMYPYVLDCLITTNENNITIIASEDFVKMVGFPSAGSSQTDDPTNTKKSPGFASVFSLFMLIVVFLCMKWRGSV
jgi:hypothetical protein